jgi:hypothetical protein
VAKESRPVFKGLNWYRQQYFSLFVPLDWPSSSWPDGREGVLFVPNAEDPDSCLAIEVKDLGMTITQNDRDDLLRGFNEGIQSLPESVLEEQKDWVVGNLICLEARYSYLEADTRRKRWVRVFYDKTRQITFIAQGSSVETFQYWTPMFYEAMMTSRVHERKPSISAEKS